MRDMNNSQKTLTSALEEPGAETGSSEMDLRELVGKRMAAMKAVHEAMK